MKKNFFALSSAALILCAAVSLTSCNDIERPAVSDNGTISVTFEQVDPELPASADEATRTGYHEKTIWWSAGDKVAFGQYASVGGDMTYKSSSVTINSDTEVLTAYISKFNTPDDATDSYYFSVYPGASFTNYSTSSGHVRARINTPAEQTPTATSFDPAADLLISNYAENLTKNGEGKYAVTLSYYRQVALGKMSIINLPSESKITTVTFKAEHDQRSVVLAGAKWYDFTTLGPTSTYSSNTTLTLDYSALEITGNMTAHFCCYPFELDEADWFEVTVTTAAGEVFTKKVTLSALQSLSFEAGRGTRFTVDMSTATKSANWLSIREYNTAPYTKATNKIYYRVRTENKTVKSAKIKAFSESAFAAIDDWETYFASNGTTMNATSISNMNGSSGYSSLYSYSSLTGDTWYVVMARVVLEDDTVGYAVGRIKTDWATLTAEPIAGGIKVTYYGKDLHTTNTRNFRVVATDLDMGGQSFADYYTSVLNPGTIASNIETVNSKNGTSGLYSNVTKHYTGKSTQETMVAGTNYTVIMKFVNLRGETKILTASADAGATE